ncbi:MAG TPA: hypothetical protein DCE23_00965 [Firmicutes bacterium]|nr:hypothetical protein [Bacillota bacterium]
MKKKLIIITSILVIIIISIVSLLLLSNKTFYLEENYYSSNEMTEINIDKLNDLTNKKESFAVFLYQPSCIASTNFENVLNEFIEKNKISIYKLTFSSIKNTDIGKKIKYYPSFIIYNKGKMVDFLESDKDEDVEYYTSSEGFTKWFTNYVKLKDN